MRKVKLLALLLAALMVVTAFAGCANTKEIESDVANLDERVSALEGKIDDVKDAIEDSNSDEELKAIQDALTKQEAANQALLEQLQKLQEELNKTNTKVEDLPTADEGLAQAQKDAAADIAARKAVYENNKADYTTKDYEAILTILEVAKTEVAAAAKSADVKAIVAQMDTDLAKYTAYDDQLYIYVTKLLGNISAASADLNKEAQKYLEAAKKHYDDNDAATTDDLVPLNKYVYGVDEDGNDLTVNLVDAMAAIDVLQNSTTATQASVVMGGNTLTYKTLNWVTTEAKDIDKKVAKLENEVLEIGSTAGKTYDRYVEWAKEAKKLGEANVALVTKADVLAEMATVLKNLSAAQDALKKLGGYDYSTGNYKDIFASYDALVASETETLIDQSSTVVTKKAVYDVIDAAIAGWQSEFKLSDKYANSIIATVKSYTDADTTDDIDTYYDQYLADRNYVAQVESKYTAFVKDIVPAIKEVNAINPVPSLTKASIDKFVSLESALISWAVIAKETTDASAVVVDDANFKLMLDREKLLIDATLTEFITQAAKAADVKVTMKNIVKFANDDKDKTVEAFFFGLNGETSTYAQAKTYAGKVNNQIENLKTNVSNLASVEKWLQVEGIYKKVASVSDSVIDADEKKAAEAYIGLYVDSTATENANRFVYVADTTDDLVVKADKGYLGYTINGFMAAYGEYGLESLLKLDKFNDTKATKEAAVATAVTAVANVEKAISDIAFFKAYLDGSTYRPYVDGETTATAVYLVNLADKAAVEAAVAARKTWYNSSMNGRMLTWVEATDAEGKVIDGAYKLDVILASELNTALNQMNDKIIALTAAADALVAHYNTLASAVKYGLDNSAFNIVSTDSATYNYIPVTNFLTYTDTTKSQKYRVTGLELVDAIAIPGQKLVSAKTIWEGQDNPEDLAGVYGKIYVEGESELSAGSTLSKILVDGHKAYEYFVDTMNCDYKLETASGKQKYTAKKDQAYAPVEEAKAALADLELSYVKVQAIAALDAAKDVTAAAKFVNAIEGYKNDVLAATSYAGVKTAYNNCYAEIQMADAEVAAAIKSCFVEIKVDGTTQVVLNTVQ